MRSEDKASQEIWSNACGALSDDAFNDLPFNVQRTCSRVHFSSTIFEEVIGVQRIRVATMIPSSIFKSIERGVS